MFYPQSVQPGYLGLFSPEQFALVAADEMPLKRVTVDYGNGLLREFISDGTQWCQSSGLPQDDYDYIAAILAATKAQVFHVPSGGAAVITAPGVLGSGLQAESFVTVVLDGATGSYTQSGHIVLGVLPPIRQSTGAAVTLRRYTYDGGYTWYILGVQPGEPIGDWTWANLAGLSATVYDGCVARVLDFTTNADGAGATRDVFLEARSGLWRAQGGRLDMCQLVAPTTPHSSTTRVAQVSVPIPAGFLAQGYVLDIEGANAKVGTNNTASLTYYLGTAGTTADTQIANNNAAAPTPAANLSYSGQTKFMVATSASVRQLGNGFPVGSFAGSNTNAVPAAVAVSNVSNTLILTAGNSVTSALDTISLATFNFSIITG